MRLEHLTDARDAIVNSTVSFATLPYTVPEMVSSPSTRTIEREGTRNIAHFTPPYDTASKLEMPGTPQPSSLVESFDKHFTLPDAAGSSRYFGSSSVFPLSVYLLRYAVLKGILPKDNAVSKRPVQTAGADHSPGNNVLPIVDEHTIRAYCRLFFTSSNVLYGIVDEISAEFDVQCYLLLREHHPVRPEELHGVEAHRYFRVSMMCAIACATKARYKPELAYRSLAFYENVLPCVKDVTSEVSPASLQALMLLIVFCLFWPRKGDIWKILDYACRLSVELGYHTEQPADHETEAQRRLRRSTFWGLYAIERIVGQLFGRGSDLPEPIITTEYPYPALLTMSESIDQTSLQPMSIAHHYRLVYLRSEIFREVYMPATSQEFDIEWYRERYAMLSDWRGEQELSVSNTGVATVTCDVGYDSTMCFIFQPLMLRAIKSIEVSAETPVEVSAVPQDNYWSACALVRSYEKVVRAPEDCVLGSYPMTFLSAHYIYLAGLTLMTHALLALDGRVKLLKRFGFAQDKEIEVDSLNFAGLFEVSHSCLLLLSWCAERWPGMEGMMQVYKNLADKIIPAMFRKGLL
jgi:hypothetical protein